MRSFSFVFLALTAASAFATPLETRASGYKVLSDGTKGTVEGAAADFGATYHASGFLSQQGCSSTAQITNCYTGELAPTGQLETKDHPPYVVGGVGAKQRAVLIAPPVTVTGTTVTHKFKIHLSTSFNEIPKGETVTLAAFHNEDPATGQFSTFALEAKTWTGEETSGTYLYINAVDKTVGSTGPATQPGFADGHTIDFTVQFSTTNGTSVWSDTLQTGVHEQGSWWKAPFIAPGTKHALTLGPARNTVDGSLPLKVWFGDYRVEQS